MRLLIAHKSSSARTALANAVPRDGDEPLEIIESSDGGDVLEMLLQEDPPALAVVDWDLPEVEGPELCRLVRDFHLGSRPYIIVLAASTHADTYDAVGAGADDCVRTPVPASAIRDHFTVGLRAALEKRTPAQRARDEQVSVRATLEAVCTQDAGTVDPARFAGVGARPDLDTGRGDADARPGVAVRPDLDACPEQDTSPDDDGKYATLESCGPVSLETMVYQS